MYTLAHLAALSLPGHLPSHLPALSTDAVIIVIILLVMAYSVMAGQGALIRETISVYVGLVLATTFGDALYTYSQHSAGGHFPVGVVGVRLILLIAPIVLLLFAHRRSHVKHHSSMIGTLVLAVLAAMLLISSVLAQLDSASLATTTDNSNLAAQIYNLRLLWVGLVPVAIAVAAFFHPKAGGSHKKI